MNVGTRRGIVIFSLLFAGEAVFTLPFHIARYFRPTFVEVLDISQTQLGELFATYGIVAMLSYLLGGGLADRFSARKLLVFSLVATASAGFFLATIPPLGELRWLYAFWGASTILPFWSALLRTTREWGGADQQGKAFGILEGGRGIIAAILASLALWLMSTQLPLADSESQATMLQRTVALRSTILFYTGTTLLAAIFVWFFLPESQRPVATTRTTYFSVRFSNLEQVIRLRAVWLHGVVIMAAYSAYKGFGFFSQFAYHVWGWSEIHSAQLSTTTAWIRPVAAISAGLLADRWRSSRVIMVAFLLTGAGFSVLPWISPGDAKAWLLWMNISIVCVGIFALRGIYFALLEEEQIPRSITGTAIGVVSFVGFIPEIVIHYLGGRLIDHWAGELTGYLVFFTLLGCGCLIGLAAAYPISAADHKQST